MPSSARIAGWDGTDRDARVQHSDRLVPRHPRRLGRHAGGAYVGQLETTDPTRGIQVRLEPDREGVIQLSASVTGPTAE